MKPSEYQQLAGRTECTQENSMMRMATGWGQAMGLPCGLPNSSRELMAIRFNHSVIGMAGEVGEIAELFMNRNTGKEQLTLEVGDLLWYMAEGMNALSINMDSVFLNTPHYEFKSSDECLQGLMMEVGALASQLQKWVYYGKYNPTERVDSFHSTVWNKFAKLLGWVKAMLDLLQIPLKTVMIANIAKLKARYPDKYSDYHAAEENRDRPKEEAEAKKATEVGHGPIDAEIDQA